MEQNCFYNQDKYKNIRITSVIGFICLVEMSSIIPRLEEVPMGNLRFGNHFLKDIYICEAELRGTDILFNLKLRNYKYS